MTVPRELGLRRSEEGPILVQRPVREMDALTSQLGERRQIGTAAANSWLAEIARPDGLGELFAEFRPGHARRFGLRLRHGDSAETTITCDAESGHVSLDRTRSGATEFSPLFAGVHTAPLSVRGGRVQLRVLCDNSSVEAFVNDGEVVLTDLMFPPSSRLTFEVFGDSPDLVLDSISVSALRSVWP